MLLIAKDSEATLVLFFLGQIGTTFPTSSHLGTVAQAHPASKMGKDRHGGFLHMLQRQTFFKSIFYSASGLSISLVFSAESQVLLVHF